jgi:methionyl-tRNA formyltransferase
MTERIDGGPVMSRTEPICLPDQVTHEDVWNRIASALPEVLAEAIRRTADGEPGRPQDPRQATYAGFPPDSWFTIDWADSRVSIHNQLRVLRLLRPGEGVVTEVSGRRIRLRGSSLEATSEGLPARCGDGAIWLTDWDEA